MMCKRHAFFCVLLLIGVLTLIPIPSYGQFTDDAIILTLRQQYEDTSGIRPDSTMAKEIDDALGAARSEIDSVVSIHAFRDYVLNQLLVKTLADWATWQGDSIWTGEPFIDSLGSHYHLKSVGKLFVSIEGWYILTFDEPLEMNQLGVVYESHPEVIYGEPNYTIGDGDDIEYFKKEGIHHLAFSRGWGDCPSGCINRYYWYVTANVTDFEPDVNLEEEKSREFGEAYIYRWNIPPRYAMTMFENADSILTAIESDSLWWVRRHAIEGTWRFFVKSGPWIGEDVGENWNELQEQLLSRREEVKDVLQSALSDPDPDVRESAERALAEIQAAGIEPAPVPVAYGLKAPYPNPFNPTTTIEFSVPQSGFVTLTIYDLLGREVETILNQQINPGRHKVQWNASSLSSGVYFVSMEGGGFTHTRKVTVVR